MSTFPPSEEKLNMDCPNQELLSFIMGDAALTEKEIAILCKRKGRNISRGLSSNEIMAYLYLKLHSCNGWCRFFTHSEFTNELGISERDIYYVLEALEKAKLIKVHGEKYSHFRDIRIYHIGVKKKTRFLSLNRSYFRYGEEDYSKFLSLSAGAKSMMLYLLFMENIKPDTRDNVIEINVSKIAQYMHLKKPTIIKYIKEVNEVWPDYLMVQKCCYGTTTDERLAELLDKRRRYGAVVSSVDFKRFTVLENNSPGFWRFFEFWLKTHGIRERSLRSRSLKNCICGTDEENIQKNRDMFFKIIYAAAQDGTATYTIFKQFFQLVTIRGFFDEEITIRLCSLLSRKSINA